MDKASGAGGIMGFSNDPAGVSNQVITSFNLPSMEDQKLFEERLEDYLRKMADAVNTKDGGIYSFSEFLGFKKLPTTNDPQAFRNVYRKFFDLVDLNGGNIASGATVNFAHGITSLTEPVMVWASCVTTDPEYFTVVYPDVRLTATNVSFTNPHASAVTSAKAYAEYTKN